MRIFYSLDSDPMLLDSRAKLNALHEELTTFLASGMKEVSIPAEVTFSPAPYQEFLKGLRLQKTQGPIMLRLTRDRWLELTGAEVHLAKYVRHFCFEKREAEGHHHPDNANYMAPSSLRLIIEADSTWAEGNAG
jgi:hypothetical protein